MLFVRITERNKKTGIETSQVYVNPTDDFLKRQFWNKYKNYSRAVSLNEVNMMDKNGYSVATIKTKAVDTESYVKQTPSITNKQPRFTVFLDGKKIKTFADRGKAVKFTHANCVPKQKIEIVVSVG